VIREALLVLRDTLALLWIGGCLLLMVVGLALWIDGSDGPAPTPTSRETPWLWVDPAPNGGAMYLWREGMRAS
jgi:hypothetical protein